MKVSAPYRCDYCQNLKGATNHWWLRPTYGPGTAFVLDRWADAIADREDVEFIFVILQPRRSISHDFGERYEKRSAEPTKAEAATSGRKMNNRTRYPYERQMPEIPEPPFRCGFHPGRHSYREYVEHIRGCEHDDCGRRFVNHMLLQTYFVRKYGGERSHGTIPANANTQGLGSSSAPGDRREDLAGTEAAAGRATDPLVNRPQANRRTRS